MNVLKQHLRVTIETLLAGGTSQHEIHEHTGVDRKTIRKYQRRISNSSMATGLEQNEGQIPPPRPPDPQGPIAVSVVASSKCEPFRVWIEEQVALSRNAQSIYQDLVEQFGFANRYNSVKRFVRTLKRSDPERFDVLEFPPGEEGQVDFGQGALTIYRPGKYRRPFLFVMTLKYSGKSFRKVTWRGDQQTWARLHEEAFRSFGGCPKYVVLDNLKQGVIRPDIYEPVINSVYASVLQHYGVTADPARVEDPDRKGTVENAIKHTQNTALKGRKFETIEAQNEWLCHWEEAWAAPRIHGRKKRQVQAMFQEEKPFLMVLPQLGFRYFREEVRTVDDAGMVQVKGSYYVALPGELGSEVMVRIFDKEIEIRKKDGAMLRRHGLANRPGEFIIEESDRIFNPSRQSQRLMEKAERIGPQALQMAKTLFASLGRPGQRALYGLTNLTKTFSKEAINGACKRALDRGQVTYGAVKAELERELAQAPAKALELTQCGEGIRSMQEYKQFWDAHTGSGDECGKENEVIDANV